MVRLALEEDDLTAFLGPPNGAHWNREQILVYEHRGEIVGLVILWDGGHSQVRVDHLVVRTGYAKYGPLFLKAIWRYMKEHGASHVVFSTGNQQLARLVVRKAKGVAVGPQYRVTVPVR